jgi:hypothetical protein
MPPSPVYNAFKEKHCVDLGFSAEVPVAKSTITRVRGCLSGKRRNLPYFFGAVYAGEGKSRIGTSAKLSRLGGNKFSLVVWWFEVSSDPPPTFGKIAELFDCLKGPFKEREVHVWVVFSYDKTQVESVFSPIQIPSQPTIFDAVVGFTGIKKDPRGNLLYQMEVSHGDKLIHTVKFAQVVRLSEELPVVLLDTAHKISSLALKSKSA